MNILRVSVVKIYNSKQKSSSASAATADGFSSTGASGGGPIRKGIGFPTCISVNHIVGHNSPLLSDKTTLKSGDVVKVDCGVQIDGYIAVGAHTFVVAPLSPSSSEKNSDESTTKPVVDGRIADVITAASIAADAV